MDDSDPALLTEAEAIYLANRNALSKGWEIIPDRAEQIAKLYNVDTSKLEIPEHQADTIPLVDQYHEFFKKKASQKGEDTKLNDEPEDESSLSSNEETDSGNSESFSDDSLNDFIVK